MKVGELREHAQALGFTPQDQVRRLSPRQLIRTAVMVAVSSLFADHADRREVQAALDGAAPVVGSRRRPSRRARDSCGCTSTPRGTG